MPAFDGESFGREIVEIIKGYLANFEKRLAALEATTLKYSGTYVEGKTYRRGEFTTCQGSLWHCEEQTSSRPGSDATWRLAVKRGELSK